MMLQAFFLHELAAEECPLTQLAKLGRTAQPFLRLTTNGMQKIASVRFSHTFENAHKMVIWSTTAATASTPRATRIAWSRNDEFTLPLR